MLTTWTAFEKLQGFDEAFELNYNDVDYCLRLWQAGYRVVMNPQVELYHHEAMRRDGRAAYRPEELKRFQQRWKSTYPHDPFLRLPPGEIC
jgi:GT2 family glycosyltransferase